MIPASGAGGPGFDSRNSPYAKPLWGAQPLRAVILYEPSAVWSYSVVVITVDFDSTDTGSNPVRTFFIFLCVENGDTGCRLHMSAQRLKGHRASKLRWRSW